MDIPGFKLHPLKRDFAGFWSVTVRANWRIIFRFEEGDATDVDPIDYHYNKRQKKVDTILRPIDRIFFSVFRHPTSD